MTVLISYHILSYYNPRYNGEQTDNSKAPSRYSFIFCSSYWKHLLLPVFRSSCPGFLCRLPWFYPGWLMKFISPWLMATSTSSCPPVTCRIKWPLLVALVSIQLFKHTYILLYIPSPAYQNLGSHSKQWSITEAIITSSDPGLMLSMEKLAFILPPQRLWAQSRACVRLTRQQCCHSWIYSYSTIMLMDSNTQG